MEKEGSYPRDRLSTDRLGNGSEEPGKKEELSEE